MTELPTQGVRLLQPHDPVANFDCGVEELNTYLQRFAWMNQQANAAVTYVAVRQEIIGGYFSVAAASAEHAQAPERLKKGLARHAIPVLLLARLAVDRRFQGVGMGKHLLREACLLALTLSKLAGIRALVVDAKDARARQFYERFDFQAFPQTRTGYSYSPRIWRHHRFNSGASIGLKLENNARDNPRRWSQNETIPANENKPAA